jgi:hypothetical protein
LAGTRCEETQSACTYKVSIIYIGWAWLSKVASLSVPNRGACNLQRIMNYDTIVLVKTALDIEENNNSGNVSIN